jgi:hypothetical protein
MIPRSQLLPHSRILIAPLRSSRRSGLNSHQYLSDPLAAPSFRWLLDADDPLPLEKQLHAARRFFDPASACDPRPAAVLQLIFSKAGKQSVHRDEPRIPACGVSPNEVPNSSERKLACGRLRIDKQFQKFRPMNIVALVRHTSRPDNYRGGRGERYVISASCFNCRSSVEGDGSREYRVMTPSWYL